MEFKKPNRYNQRQLRQDVSPHGGSRPPQRPASVEKTDATLAPATPPIDTEPQSSIIKKAAKLHIRRFLFNKKIIITIGVVAVITTGSIVAIKQSNSGTNTVANAPSYQTILPNNKSIKELGGWKRISPPENDPVFAYADKIGSVPISISQQPLPKSFQNNTDDQLAELAKKFNATVKLDAGDTTVYIGTSAKGPQSAILTKNNLLIMIKSQKKINNESWVKYTESLS